MSPSILFGILVVLAVTRGVLYLQRRSATAPPTGGDTPKSDTVTEYLDSILVAGGVALVLIHFVVRTFYIPSGSMQHTLEINDFILVNEWVYDFYRPQRGDIVVFKPPPEAHDGDKDLIKRVIAVEGETVSMHNETIYINGQPLAEPYKFIAADLPGSGEMEPVTVPPGCLWMMGDNRHNSADSRFWGFLPVKNIIGKASFIFFPPSRMQMLAR